MKAKDRIGQMYNNLEVLDVKRENHSTYAYCLCHNCNKKKWMRIDSLKTAKTCGCINGTFKPIDIKGQHQKNGKLTAIERTDKRDKLSGSVIWKCRCDCGNYTYVTEFHFKSERVRSCDCLATIKHKIQGKKLGDTTKEYCVDGTNIRNLTSKISKNNTSGHKGVTYKKERDKWVAQITFKGKHYNLGSYNKKEDAIIAREKAEENLFKKYMDEYKKNRKDQ